MGKLSNNPTVIDFLGDSVEYDQYGGTYLWGQYGKKEGVQMVGEVNVGQVRGWGAIQHLFKTEDEAKAFQDKVGNFIAEAITEKIQKEKQVKTTGITNFYPVVIKNQEKVLLSIQTLPHLKIVLNNKEVTSDELTQFLIEKLK